MGMNVLSPFSFYGGKAKMSELICKMIDYKNTDIYIEPFGGAARVLLNKPRHKVEIYNDFGIGLYEFFYAMSKPELSGKVISALCDITPGREIFDEKKDYKTKHEEELTDHMQLKTKELVYALAKKYGSKELKELHKLVINKEYVKIIGASRDILGKGIIQDKEDIKEFKARLGEYENYWNLVGGTYNKVYAEARQAFQQALKKTPDAETVITDKDKHRKSREIALDAIEDYTSDILIANGSEYDMKDVDMAVATFITYYLSRDGMGKYYSEAKGNSFQSYYNQVMKLEDIADRLQGVAVTQVDALQLIAGYSQAKNAMLYLDPSYLKVNDSRKDLGKGIYNRSFDYSQHERLAEMIQDAEAYIILSNYDVPPYTDYLTESHGWKRIEVETTTGVGSKKDNQRTEVLWYNF